MHASLPVCYRRRYACNNVLLLFLLSSLLRTLSFLDGSIQLRWPKKQEGAFGNIVCASTRIPLIALPGHFRYYA